MRKFKAYDKKSKTIREVLGLNFLDNKVVLRVDSAGFESVDFDDVELLQDTWFEDKNGNSIYEGDSIYDVNGVFLGDVFYSSGGACYCVYNGFECNELSEVDWSSNIEIRGNKFDNKFNKGETNEKGKC